MRHCHSTVCHRCRVLSCIKKKSLPYQLRSTSVSRGALLAAVTSSLLCEELSAGWGRLVADGFDHLFEHLVAHSLPRLALGDGEEVEERLVRHVTAVTVPVLVDCPLPASDVGVACADEALLQVIQLSLQVVAVGLHTGGRSRRRRERGSEQGVAE